MLHPSLKNKIKPHLQYPEASDAWFQISQDILGVANWDGKIQRLNRSWETTLGFTIAESRQFFQLVHPDDREFTLAKWQQLAGMTNGTVNFQNRYRRSDGTYIKLSWTVTSRRQLVYFTGRFTPDLLGTSHTGNYNWRPSCSTDHNSNGKDPIQTAKMLWEQAQIIDQIHDAVITTDLQGIVTSWNQGAVRLFGYSTFEILGQNLSWIYPEGFSHTSKFVRQQIIAPLQQQGCMEMEVQLRRKGGAKFWAHLSLTVLRDEAGLAVGTIGCFQDIEERKAAEEGLKKANEELEARVEARTAALSATLSQLEEVVAQLHREIKERQRVEEHLRHSQDMLQLILDNIPQYIFWKDTNSVYQGCNRNFARIAGVSNPEDIIGKTDYDLPWKPEEAEGFRELDRRAIQADRAEYHILQPRLQANGKQAWMDVNKIPLHDGCGKVVGLLGTMEDVTDRLKAAEALAKSEAKFRSLIQNSSDLITILEPDGIVRYASPALEKITGFKPEDLIGKNVLEIVHPKDSFLITKEFENLVNNPSHLVSVELRCRQRDGSWCWLEVTCSNLLADPAVTGIVVNSRDITERKRADSILRESEQALREQAHQLETTLEELKHTQTQLIQTEKMSSLGLLVAGVAHEINNPVNFIHGNISHAKLYVQDLLNILHLYQEKYPDPGPEITAIAEEMEMDFLMTDLPKMLNSMKLGSERIQDIVLSLRNFSRVDEGGMKEADIHQGIDDTVLILQHRLRDGGKSGAGKSRKFGIELMREYGDLPKVQCNIGQLNQVFMNILANAIDALEEAACKNAEAMDSQPQIRIRTEVRNGNAGDMNEGRGEAVVIRISDNGPGMSEEVIRRLFDPFFTTKPVGKGTGLGLAISYQIVVEKHKGSLGCVSAPGKGTEFTIAIPLRQN
ncbi:PAS domain S-box protein [[Phormidium] sp. ETS-05]|uniref:PAS domain-containing sensor histidine kinase n=1 Tax=[Phormidium] sp. ETS-05 TaxID=222819 RepID=UPI0018EEED3D|nr:PAS domain S-box protein [[Phormidium] sp. ETS-05]